MFLSKVRRSIANVSTKSISNGCIFPGTMSEWSGAPKSTPQSCSSVPAAILDSTDPTRASPTAMVKREYTVDGWRVKGVHPQVRQTSASVTVIQPKFSKLTILLPSSFDLQKLLGCLIDCH